MPPFKLTSVLRVEFYKRHERRRDVLCCDITTRQGVISAHERLSHWDELIRKLEFLGGFDVEWFLQLSQPEVERYVAFERKG
ncbi:hypothetical protein H0274_13015 [Altererythrobacter sp. CC-YST694]|uniref:hypothetical protein n=1 Tax=Altererythrobacter sp. CC-YST694 TaxID=2755038 RepID=UPI001D007161|nr:hypothetical protein [Altererythrobacter sp. CC-YST694]MCB5426182.1 hypothetical protein [Altererythrobacter sp. CC-YST694]